MTGGPAGMTLNETACAANEWVSNCCQPPCVTSCAMHMIGCVDVLLGTLRDNRRTLIAIGCILGVLELLGLVLVTTYYVTLTKWANTGNTRRGTDEEDDDNASTFDGSQPSFTVDSLDLSLER